MSALIRAEQVRKVFGERVAVADLNLEVAEGEIYALVGPDGAGKTTTMRLLCGALEADEGEVILGGYNLRRQTEEARAQIGYLPQRFSLYGELTVAENLRFFAEVRGLSGREWKDRSQEILAFVGLDAFVDRRAEALSGGMKQKLGLAAAMIHRPRILLLDEPTGGVDPVTRQQFWQLLIRLMTQGVAVLVSTPYMDEAARCSRVGFMHRGQIVIEGTPQAITASFRGSVVELHGGPRRLLERVAVSDPEVKGVQVFGDRLHLHLVVGASPEVIPRLERSVIAEGGLVDSLHLVAPGLEDVFIELLEEAG